MTIQSIAQAEQNILKCKQLCNRAGVRFSSYSMEPEQTFYKRIINAIDYDSNDEECKLWTSKYRVAICKSKITVNYETDDDEIEYMSDETLSKKLSKPNLKFEDVPTKNHRIEYIDDETKEVKIYTTNSLRIDTSNETVKDLQSAKTDVTNKKIIEPPGSDYIAIKKSEIDENYMNHSDDESSPLINRKGFQFSDS
tara:strand:- start:5035 stop:5622 length:588 start_codon:yes stop_codon:yes gene_type:complete